jgi:dihydroneopterin aldolase
VDAILLEGIQVPAALGVTAAERALRRPVLIDLALACDLAPAGRSDDLAQTIDYAQVYRAVADVAGRGEHHLVEALAQRIADTLLATLPSVREVRLRIRKIAPIPGAVQYAGVEVVRGR